MNNSIKISVIVPIYNVEKYLSRCVDSILNSNYKNLEIILVDDGSTDSCGHICDEYKMKDRRIKVIHKENGGLSDARNKGIDIATGDYISFVDSDDAIDNDMFDYLLKILLENKCDISVCNYITFSTIELPKSISKYSKTKVYTNESALDILLNGKISHSDYAWNKLYKRDLFKNIRYPVGRKMEDIGTTYKLYYIAKKIVIGDAIKYYYYQRNNSILGKNSYLNYKDNLELSITRYKFLKNKKLNINYINYEKDIIKKILELYKHTVTQNQLKYFYDNSYDKMLTCLNLKKTLKGESIKFCIKYFVYKRKIKKGRDKYERQFKNIKSNV